MPQSRLAGYRRALGIIRVGDRPGEALDQLLGRMIVAEVGRVDLLIE
jgi:hypothetical protein